MEKWIFFLIFGAIIAITLIRIIRFGGIKASMFGARIEETIGAVEVSHQYGVRQKLQIHVLRESEDQEHCIGVELDQSTVSSWRMTGVTLTIAEAKQLTELLSEAIGAQD